MPLNKNILYPLLALLTMSTPAWSLPAEKPSPPPQEKTGPLAEAGAVVPWVKERVKNSGRGRKEIVRIPLARRTEDWGCPCPESYIGLQSSSNNADIWLDVTYESSVKPLSQGEIGLAEGFFTGQAGQTGSPAEGIYRLFGFHVLKLRKLPSDHNAIADIPENHVVILPQAGK